MSTGVCAIDRSVLPFEAGATDRNIVIEMRVAVSASGVPSLERVQIDNSMIRMQQFHPAKKGSHSSQWSDTDSGATLLAAPDDQQRDGRLRRLMHTVRVSARELACHCRCGCSWWKLGMPLGRPR